MTPMSRSESLRPQLWKALAVLWADPLRAWGGAHISGCHNMSSHERAPTQDEACIQLTSVDTVLFYCLVFLIHGGYPAQQNF